METSSLETDFGSPFPLGISKTPEGINFAVFSKHATKGFLLLFKEEEKTPLHTIPLIQTQAYWHIRIKSLPSHLDYAFRFEGQNIPKDGHFFNSNVSLLDPYAKHLHASSKWNTPSDQKLRGKIVFDTPFDWENDSRPLIPMEDLIIYEMHVRGFTQSPSSQVKHPGTFLGILEKIPHLKSLGINAVELMPIFEFNEKGNGNQHPETGENLFNYWGYSSSHFFCPMYRYGTPLELKTLIKALHQNHIEVILDVVYNHTSEGSNPHFYESFRGIDNKSYYMMDGKHYLNYTGCGNTFNCNHPPVQNLILDSLRHWVLEYHVDGFRFDLASILTRGETGEPMDNPPLIKAITKDPLLFQTKLIAEPWDAAGLYQVGSFPSWRFAEWNGKYRDTIRRFLKGSGSSEDFFMRIKGSPDLYLPNRKPYHSINFVTSHDGFTLKDLVSYQEKHNALNGENNRDGTSCHESWNCGIEGDTHDSEIKKLRTKQMKNFMVALLCSQGIPMILMGDEYGHTKKGNNNTWCHDNHLNYFLWDQLDKNQDFFLFLRYLIAFRKNTPLLHSPQFLDDKALKRQTHDHNSQQRLSFQIKDPVDHQHLYIAFNASYEFQELTLPSCDPKTEWMLIMDTNQVGNPSSLFPSTLLVKHLYTLSPYSSIILKQQSSSPF